MYGGARVTDAVEFFKQRGEMKVAVKVVRERVPERFRWRKAVGSLTSTAGKLRGKDRMRIEEPIREMVLDVEDGDLRREVVLDSRRNGVDLDRGELLPRRTVGDLRRYSFLTGTDLTEVQRYVHLPLDFFAPVDTAAAVLVGRAFSEHHRHKAQRIWLRLPDADTPDALPLHQRLMAEHASREARLAERWVAFAKALLDTK
jgi:hypothetical protein